MSTMVINGRRSGNRPKINGKAAAGSTAFSPSSIAWNTWVDSSLSLFQLSGGTTPAVSDADPVGYMGDQGSLGNNLIQATAGKRGTLKLNIHNGMPCVRFDGVSNNLRTAGSINFTLPSHFFVVFSTAWAANTVIMDVSNNAAPFMQFYNLAPTPTLTLYNGATAPITTQLATGTVGIMEFEFNGASSYLAINNNADITGNSGASGAVNRPLCVGAQAGASAFGALDLYALFGINATLNATQRTNMRTYLNTRFACF